ncbi:ABC transporter ATP-binding protein [Dermatobacter hominis]|uniref:ABC transporter ATP-binding protein n=1 Tax=Dermatobacter hominis TaxID=2884263 RepID=UPI001D10C1A6|nr:ABC transporter ATP-binding protein [Dermatobacter hominis]UDY37945.1 ABC transporter ATP-binding protein [Dermatobacter hominis]
MTAALEVRDLSVRYGGVVALDGVTLAVPAGELHGLIGPNGAGKTTFLDGVSGFARPSSGAVVVGGVDCTALPPHRIARLGLTRTFQTLELFDDLTVEENLAVVAAATPAAPTLHEETEEEIPLPSTAARVEDALSTVGLERCGGGRPTTLSNVDRRRVALARALVAEPTVLLLDEPAAGLDPGETAELAELLQRISAAGTAVLLVEHDMALVLGSCATVHVLDAGRLIASGSPEDVRIDPEVLRAYLGVT